MNDIASLEAKLKELKNSAAGALPKSSGWLSRKLLTLLVIAGIVIFLGREQISAVIVSLSWLCLGYLLVQGIVDAVREWQAGKLARAHVEADAMIRIAWIDAAARDGFDDAEKAKALEAAKPPTTA